MALSNSPPLYEKIPLKNTFQRALDVTILCLLLSLVIYRLLTFNKHGFAWFLALVCESWFTFIWFLGLNIKWSPVVCKTYPKYLLQGLQDLPPVDMFVTTTEPVLEPPLLTINTVLSLLAVDYPAHKLACYVSDDGCSSIIYYSLIEASKFAKIWIPFCKRYSVQVRAPFRYFTDKSHSLDCSLEFQLEWKKMKDEYEKLSRKINDAAQKSVPCDLTGEFVDFSNTERSNHQTIIKVIWENKGLSDGLPHLIYISRQKLLKHPHHYKAGAMNVLTRVSGLMTNAPFILNLDCDMYVNNPQVVHHAMCILLGSADERESGFVQFPQMFYDGIKDDPFGNQYTALQEVPELLTKTTSFSDKHLEHGLGGIQGPIYCGTNCFHRRKVIYGQSPNEGKSERRNFPSVKGELDVDELHKMFGKSKELVKLAAISLSSETGNPSNPLNTLEAARQVANCDYEYGTGWGSKVGWFYGCTTEDILTGLVIHTRGWKSVYCKPNLPAFLGCAPSGGPSSLIQMKRWATGLLEVLVHKNSPIFGLLYGKLRFRQCLGYIYLLAWGLRSIFEVCYAALPAYCIITNSSFLPKVKERAINIPIALFVIYNIYTLSEYLGIGLSIRAWWNNQRMAKINSTSAWLLGFLSVILKIIGLSETVFEVTQKDQYIDGEDVNAGRFTFIESPIFVPGTTLVLLQLTAMGLGLFGMQPPEGHGGQGSGTGEFVCSLLVLTYFWPFFKGLFGRGKYGIPSSILVKSSALTLLFVHFSRSASFGKSHKCL